MSTNISSRQSNLNFAHHSVIYWLFQNVANKNQHQDSYQRETIPDKFERHFEIWFPKKKTIKFFWSKLSKLHKKDSILHVTTTFSLKQGKTRTNSVPIPHPLIAQYNLSITNKLVVCTVGLKSVVSGQLRAIQSEICISDRPPRKTLLYHLKHRWKTFSKINIMKISNFYTW